MGLEDLQEQGVLLPKEEWGKHSLKPTVAKWWLLAVFAAGVASLVASYLGDGGPLTWIGVGVFLVVLYTATILCDRAVERQRERMERR